MSKLDWQPKSYNYLVWKRSDLAFGERVAFASGGKKLDPNCQGTSFFLLGVLPYDVVVFNGGNGKEDNLRTRNALKRMMHSIAPIDNSLLISLSNSGTIMHASYILTTKPFFGYHRMGSGGPFEKITNISDIERYLEDVDGEKKIGEDKDGRWVWGHAGKPYRHEFYTLKPQDRLVNWAKGIVKEYRPNFDC
ncbi:MAG: hypothetical protein WD876_01475 [Candidatus Pacearchaeota archaeon]